MKKFLGFLLVLVIIVAIAGQYLLPKYIGMRIEDQLDESLHPSDQTVVVESMPAVKLLYGDVDAIRGNLENVKLGALSFTGFHYELDNITVNPVTLIMNQKLDVLSVQKSTMKGIVTKDDLTQYMEAQVKGLENTIVSMKDEKITVTGTINVGGFLKGKAEITGMLDLNKNVLYFEPQRFTLNGTTISGLNSSLLEPIAIYDFNEFPISVKADSISVKDEAIRIKVTPIIE